MISNGTSKRKKTFVHSVMAGKTNMTTSLHFYKTLHQWSQYRPVNVFAASLLTLGLGKLATSWNLVGCQDVFL